jgi:hypothetical protein
MSSIPTQDDPKQALLASLEFMARLATSNPPKEIDRQMAMGRVQAALLKIDPTIKDGPWYGQFFHD